MRDEPDFPCGRKMWSGSYSTVATPYFLAKGVAATGSVLGIGSGAAMLALREASRPSIESGKEPSHKITPIKPKMRTMTGCFFLGVSFRSGNSSLPLSATRCGGTLSVILKEMHNEH